jgi:hypothetical protein
MPDFTNEFDRLKAKVAELEKRVDWLNEWTIRLDQKLRHGSPAPIEMPKIDPAPEITESQSVL